MKPMSEFQFLHPASTAPVKVILDTDIEFDVDDVGAVAVLHALADLGYAEVLAMLVSAKHDWSPACLNALNHYYGRPQIPIGQVGPEGVEFGSEYARKLAEAHQQQNAQELNVRRGVDLYRETLAAQADQSVVLISIGFLTILDQLLASPADEISELCGLELVAHKVTHWVCMGGHYPNGNEYNFIKDGPAAANAVNHWPTPITFSGQELGKRILTGTRLVETPEENPVRKAYEHYFDGTPLLRPSWDQATVLYGVLGLQGGLSELWDVVGPGCNRLDETGMNAWDATQNREHRYLVEKMPADEVAWIIEELMIREPAISMR